MDDEVEVRVSATVKVLCNKKVPKKNGFMLFRDEWSSLSRDEVEVQRFYERASIQTQWKFNQADVPNKTFSLIFVDRFNSTDTRNFVPCEIAVISFQLVSGIVGSYQAIIGKDDINDKIALIKVCERIHNMCEEKGARRIYCLNKQYDEALATIEGLKKMFNSGGPSQLKLNCVEDLFLLLSAWYNVAVPESLEKEFDHILDVKFPPDFYFTYGSSSPKSGEQSTFFKAKKIWYFLVTMLVKYVSCDEWSYVTPDMYEWDPVSSSAVDEHKSKQARTCQAEKMASTKLCNKFTKLAVEHANEDGDMDDEDDDHYADYPKYCKQHEKNFKQSCKSMVNRFTCFERKVVS
ncbi:unnamed protein product [Soboliphyme baturini]|uniref:Defective in cullin neddylation protein n=1 Tax=Soboliphyme baturini TaxID=241478 RepID=A0A183IVC6_9BILA|nr:unnamed protein product [Soboliphyme baturini]